MKPPGRWIGRRLPGYIPHTWVAIGKIFSGLFVRNLLRGMFKLLLPAFLAPQAMGVLRATVSFYRIVCSLTDLGLNHAVTVFVPAALRRNDERERDEILMTTVVVFAGIIVVVSVAGMLVADRLAVWALGDASLVVFVRLAVLAASGRLIWRFFSSSLAASQEFGRLALYFTTIPALMLGSGVVLAVLHRLTLTAAVVITLVAPVVTVLVWWPFVDRRFVGWANWNGPLALRLLRFSRWVYLSSIGSSLRNHLNPLLLKSPQLSGTVAAGEASAGLYGFGNDLANELQLLSGSLVTVLVPKASSKSGPEELRAYVKRAYAGILLLLIPVAPLFLLAEPALRLLGRLSRGYLEYLPSIEVFSILYIGVLFSIATIPIMTALYAMRLPQIETRVEIAMIPVLIVGAILLIPRYGPNGAALTVLIQRIASFAILTSYGFLRLKRWKGDAVERGLPG